MGDQVVPQGLVEVHAEAGNTIPTRVFAFTAGMIAPDKMQCVPERRYKLVSSGAERTYSPRTLFSRMKLMAARYCSALEAEALMLPRSVVSGTTTSVGVSAGWELINVAIRHTQLIRRSARKVNRSLLASDHFCEFEITIVSF